MNRKEIRKLWNRRRTDPEFHLLLLAIVYALLWTDSTPRDQIAACALADYTLRKAGAKGRREMRRRSP
jgi:hypothetical protein